jgi:hypothetical protein
LIPRRNSPLAPRDWGDRAAYFMDHDGYVIAVAQRMERGGSVV